MCINIHTKNCNTYILIYVLKYIYIDTYILNPISNAGMYLNKIFWINSFQTHFEL